MRAFSISSKDITGCPIGSLSPSHYRNDGTCHCLPEATVPQGGLNMAWDEQVRQYPKAGKPGIELFVGVVEIARISRNSDGKKVGRVRYEIDSLLYRNSKGAVIGILQWFGEGAPDELQKPGDFNVLVHPRRQRRGIGTALMHEAERRWGTLNFDQQMFTPAGRAVALAFLKQRNHERSSS